MITGFKYVPAHRYNRDKTDDLPKGMDSKAHHAAKRGARTNRLQWSRNASLSFGARLSEDLEANSTWEDLEQLLGDEGLSLEEKGQGLVVGDGQSYAKFSNLGLTISAKAFEKRRKRKHTDLSRLFEPKRERKPLFSVDGVDIARALASMGLGDQEDIANAVQTAVEERAQARGLSTTTLTPAFLAPEPKPAKRRRQKPANRSR